MDTRSDTLDHAHALRRAGQLDAAAAAYRAVLAREPSNAIALQGLGNLLSQCGAMAQAAECFRQQVEIEPANAAAHYNLGHARKALGQYRAAVESFRQAIALKPDYFQAYNNLGLAWQALGERESAAVCYRQTLAIKPDHAYALNNLGVILLEEKRLEEAADYLRRATQAAPDYAQAFYNLGRVAQAHDDAAQALVLYRRALALQPDYVNVMTRAAELLYKQGDRASLAEAAALYRRAAEREPQQPEHWNGLGVVLQAQGEIEQARRCFIDLTQRFPRYSTAYNNLGILLRRQRQYDPAIAALQTAVRLAPDDVMTLVNLSNTLLEIHRVSDALAVLEPRIGNIDASADAWQAYNDLCIARLHQARYAEALAAIDRARELSPGNGTAISNTLFASLYDDRLSAAEVSARHRELAARWPRPAVPAPWLNSRDAERPLRVGYLSADLRAHPVAYFLEPILSHHDPARIEAICYHSGPRGDAMTERLRQSARGWHECGTWGDEHVCRQVRADAIDILVDLSGHTANNRLGVLTRKPAPIQALYIGYPCTSGIAEVDYLIADARVCPPESDALYSETVLRLEDSFWCFRPHPEAPPVAPPPYLAKGYVTFGCFNHTPKLSPTTLALWAKLLQIVPDARLMLSAGPFFDAPTRELFLRRFADLGVAPARIEIRPPSALADYLAHYNRVDIALDPFPFNGGTTSCEALLMGVPLVSLAGEHFYSRMGLSFLTSLGLPELVAQSPDDYVRIAGELAADRERLATLRQGLRARFLASPICASANTTRQLEAAYREIWRRWLTRD